MQLADDSNPGIPPGSLSSFLRVKPSVEGAILADHGAAYRNAFYQSHLDTVDNIEPESLGAAAAIIARAVHALASSPATPSLQVHLTHLLCNLYLQLVLSVLCADKRVGYFSNAKYSFKDVSWTLCVCTGLSNTSCDK